MAEIKPQFEDGPTTADALAVLANDLEIGALRLKQLLGGRLPGQRIDSLPKRERKEVRAIQAMFREWGNALQEARRG